MNQARIEQLKRAQAISHERRRGKPLPNEVRAKIREKALTPERIKIAISNLPKWTKENNPFIGRKFSEETKKKMSLAKQNFIPWNKGKSNVQDMSHVSGSNNWNWRGGITSENKRARDSFEYKKWRTLVFERDKYTCQTCGIKGSYLEADHIKPFAYFPKLRYELTNGRTLCKGCHNATKISAKKMREIYATI